MTLNSRPALQTALAHRSIRRFTAEPVSDEMLSAVLEAARASSTSSYLQNGSIIRVTDIAVRKELRAVCAAEGGAGHAYVEHCAEFLVFCIDAARHHALDDAVQRPAATPTPAVRNSGIGKPLPSGGKNRFGRLQRNRQSLLPRTQRQRFGLGATSAQHPGPAGTPLHAGLPAQTGLCQTLNGIAVLKATAPANGGFHRFSAWNPPFRHPR